MGLRPVVGWAAAALTFCFPLWVNTRGRDAAETATTYGLIGFDQASAAAEYVTFPAADLAPTTPRCRHAEAAALPLGALTPHRQALHEHARNQQIICDVITALDRGRNCLVLTQRTRHLKLLETVLRERGFDPVVLRGGMGAKARAAALTRLRPRDDGDRLLAIATGSYIGEGFDAPVLDTLFLTAPIAFKGRLVQYVGRVIRPHPGKITAEVHDYHDVLTRVLASSLAKRAAGYTSLGFPDPRRLST